MASRWQRSRLMHFAPATLAWLSSHADAVIFVNLSLGLLGVPALTEALLVTAGAVAAHGSGSACSALAAAVAGSAVGMTISFHVGRAAQPTVQRWAASMSTCTRPRRAARAHEWWRRLGPWSVVLAYFAPGLRHATAIVAGSMNMERKRFVALAVCGACAWSSLLVFGGSLVGARAAAPVAPADFCAIIDADHADGDPPRADALGRTDGSAGGARAGGCVVEDVSGAWSNGRR